MNRGTIAFRKDLSAYLHIKVDS